MILLVVGVANAGTVAGKIHAAKVSGAVGDKEAVVVWLEGEKESKPPDTSVRISQRNLQFSPDFLVAVKGQKIEMPNDDDVAHNVYSFAGLNQFNLGVYAKGEYRSVVFDKTGPVDFYCSIHRQMHARVFVVPSRFYVSSRPGQSFSISDVPPGKYTLKVWHERSRMVEMAVTVPRDGTVTENITLETAAQAVAATQAKE
jgi:plastocyanin